MSNLLRAALSYMLSNLDDVNETLGADFQEQEVQRQLDTLTPKETNLMTTAAVTARGRLAPVETRIPESELWAKLVTAVAEKAKTGHHWEGDFVRGDKLTDLEPGSLLISCDNCGSRRHPKKHAYLMGLLPDGTWTILADSKGDEWAYDLREEARKLLALPDAVARCHHLLEHARERGQQTLADYQVRIADQEAKAQDVSREESDRASYAQVANACREKALSWSKRLDKLELMLADLAKLAEPPAAGPVDAQLYYLQHKGVRCPFCQGDRLDGDRDSLVFQDGQGTCSERVTCASCGAEWLDHYTLTGFSKVEDDDA